MNKILQGLGGYCPALLILKHCSLAADVGGGRKGDAYARGRIAGLPLAAGGDTGTFECADSGTGEGGRK